MATTQKFDKKLFLEAITATAIHRGTAEQIKDVDAIIKNIYESNELRDMWNKYRKQFAYAKDIEFDDIILEISKLLWNHVTNGGNIAKGNYDSFFVGVRPALWIDLNSQ